MNERKRIACFFTAGYTELNAMKSFLGKINDRIEYIQLCPTGPRKSKRAIQNRHISQIDKNQNGMTGKKLIDFAVDFVGGKRFEEEEYDAILIEDDKDERFLFVEEDGEITIDKKQWEIFKHDAIKRFRDKRPDIPVIFFYAAPEIEAWFLADWENGFGSVYQDIFNTRQNNHFRIKFRKYVNENILTDQYKSCIEKYGYFDGKYRKLSEEIQNALEETDFLEDYMPGKEHPMVRYSKKRQGGAMLERIEPKVVLNYCSFWYKEGYWALSML